MRNELQRARDDYEDIVTEIHGGLDILKWVKKAVYFPHFADAQTTTFPFSSHTTSLDNSKSDRRECREISTETDSGFNRKEDGDDEGLPEKLEAERDVSENNALVSEPQDVFNETVVKETTNAQYKGDAPGREGMDSARDFTTVWSSVDTDMDLGRSVKGEYNLSQKVFLNRKGKMCR